MLTKFTGGESWSAVKTFEGTVTLFKLPKAGKRMLHFNAGAKGVGDICFELHEGRDEDNLREMFLAFVEFEELAALEKEKRNGNSR